MKKTRKKVIIFICLSLIVILATAMTSGKYLYNSVWNYYLKSKGFYFESDLLEVNTKKNSLLKWDGSDIYFSLKNNLNQELISESDISYKITCTVLGDESDYIDCVLNGTNSSTFNGSLASEAYCINNTDTQDVSALTKSECELNNYVWYEEITSKDNYFNFVLKDETKNIDEVSVKITAESIVPYKKILTGIFNINKVETMDTEFEVDYQSFSDHDELSIINKVSTDKCFLINFDSSNYSFDISNDSILGYSVDSNKKVNQIEFKVEKKNSAIYNFFKVNSEKVYSIDDFIIEEKEC